MSLVNAETGELIAECTADEARQLTDRINVAVGVVWELILQAYQSRAWAALGYGSWDDYCTREFGSARLKLPRETRQEVVASLREQGLSLRAIASATGQDEKNVRNDLVKRRAEYSAPEPDDDDVEDYQPPTITGTDGKTYRPKPKPKPAPVEYDDDFADDEQVIHLERRKLINRRIARLADAWAQIESDPAGLDKHDYAELRIVGREIVAFVEKQ